MSSSSFSSESLFSRDPVSFSDSVSLLLPGPQIPGLFSSSFVVSFSLSFILIVSLVSSVFSKLLLSSSVSVSSAEVSGIVSCGFEASVSFGASAPPVLSLESIFPEPEED